MIRPVDPRDVSWEDHQPVFRVHLDVTPTAATGPGFMVTVSEHEITGADVAEVLAWAAAQDCRGYVVYAMVRRAEGLGAIVLLGRDPAAAPEPQHPAG